MKKNIIAISRSYGSGGNAVGKTLAAELGIPFYEKAIIEMAADKSGLSADYIDKLESNASRSFLFNLVSSSYPTVSMGIPQYDVPVTYTAFSAQSEVIRELAAHGSCVVVGRCSEYVLRDDPDCIKVFIYANYEDRLNYTMKAFDLDQKAAESRLSKIDKGRANYYKTYTGETWGSLYNHDICINTSHCGTDGAVNAIMAYLKSAGKLD